MSDGDTTVRGMTSDIGVAEGDGGADGASTRGKIAFATIEFPPLVPDANRRSTFVEDAWRPGVEVIKRGKRRWRMAGRLQPLTSSMLYGRIGFERPPERTERWDDAEQDFIITDVQQGATAPFVIDTSSWLVAFQLRSQINRQQFAAALEELLVTASRLDGWHVVPLVTTQSSFRGWASTVDRVTTLRIKLRRPNPNYRGRKKVEEIIEGAHVIAATIDYTALPDDDRGINLEDAIVSQAIEHVELNYGTIRATGQRNGRPEAYNSKTGEVAVEVQAGEVEPETGEVRPTDLSGALDSF